MKTSGKRLSSILLLSVLLGLMAACSKTPTRQWTSSNKITSNGFEQPKASGSITGTSISVTVPKGTDVTHLVAEFSYDGSSVKVGSTPQVSGTPPNDFSSPVTYTVMAQDSTTQNYTVKLKSATIQWTDRGSAGARNWVSIASSSDGSHLAAAVSAGGDIWTGK